MNLVTLSPEEARAHALVIEKATTLTQGFFPPRHAAGLHAWLRLRDALRALKKIEEASQ